MKKNYISIIFFFLALGAWSQEYRRMISAGTYSVEEIKQEADTYFSIVGKERGKGYNPYKRWEYSALRNMDENGILKTPDFYFQELENYNMENNEVVGESYRTTEGTWEQMGPTSWNATTGWNPGVGRVTSIAIEEANTNHIIVGGQSGGVWKTLDGGLTWTVLTDNLSNIYVYSLAIDPNNNSTYFWGSNGGAIFKSTDAGSTWNLLSTVGTGDVNKILIDPISTNKMYCSAQGGGIYKSADSGINWTRIHPGANEGYDVEFKPSSNGSVVYASGNAFYKSVDGGVTFQTDNTLPPWSQEYITGGNNWSKANSNQNGTVTPRTGTGMALCYKGDFSSPITRLISPTINLTGATSATLNFSYTQAVWAGDQDEIKVLYKTSASGNWIELANYTANIETWTDITLNLPNTSSDYFIAFEGTANYGYGITLDDVSIEDASLGTVFQDGFESGSTANEFASGPKMIGVSVDNPEVVYILEADGGVFGGFHKSTNSGTTFAKLDHGNNNYFGYSSTANDDSGQAPRDMDIAVSPNDINEVHIAGVLTWRSIDGGANFNVTSQWTETNAAADNIGYCHADVDILLFSGTDLYAGTDGGIFVAENTAVINTSYYRDLTSGLGIRQFYKIGISQTDPEVVTGGSQDNGTSFMDTSGNWFDWLGADGMESFIDKNNNDIMYGTSQNGSLYKTTNGGVSYNGIASPAGDGNWITPFEQDPITPNTIYSGYNRVYKSPNGGINWTPISQDFGGNLNHLKIASSNNSVMYAAIETSLFKTENGGAFGDWNELTGFSGSINSIAIHPIDPNKVAIATTADEKVYVSNDGGATWSSYLYNLPNFSALAMVWQDNEMDGLYVGMNYGVYYIDATFSEWQPFSNNLPNVEISEFEINTANNKIYAGTFGRGLWRSNVFDASLSIDEFSFKNLNVYPNPAYNEINLSWNSSESVSIKVYNTLGKLMYFNTTINLANKHKIDVSNYASGIYFIKINNAKGVVTKKIIVN